MRRQMNDGAAVTLTGRRKSVWLSDERLCPSLLRHSPGREPSMRQGGRLDDVAPVWVSPGDNYRGERQFCGDRQYMRV